MLCPILHNAAYYAQGISFADSRINLNSASYTNGYNVGINASSGTLKIVAVANIFTRVYQNSYNEDKNPSQVTVSINVVIRNGAIISKTITGGNVSSISTKDSSAPIGGVITPFTITSISWTPS